MLNADFQKLVKKNGPSAYFAVLRESVYAARGVRYELDSVRPGQVVKARLLSPHPTRSRLNLSTFQNAPGSVSDIAWPGAEAAGIRELAGEWGDEVPRRSGERAAPETRTKSYLFVIDDVDGKPAAVFSAEVKRVVGEWSADFDTRVAAETAVAAREKELVESRASRVDDARAKGQQALNARVLSINTTSDSLLGKTGSVRITSTGEVAWDAEKDRPVYSVTGTVTLTLGDYTKLLNIISELQAEVSDRGY